MTYRVISLGGDVYEGHDLTEAEEDLREFREWHGGQGSFHWTPLGYFEDEAPVLIPILGSVRRDERRF